MHNEKCPSILQKPISRRALTGFLGGAICLMALGKVATTRLCSWQGRLSDLLPKPLYDCILKLRPLLRNIPFTTALSDRIDGVFSCPAQSLQQRVLEAAREDQQDDRLIVVENWIIPETLLLLAQETLRERDTL